jgi:valyl-tRNA synthetase
VYQQLNERGEEDFIMTSKFTELKEGDVRILKEGEKTKEIITAIRDTRNRNSIKQKQMLILYTTGGTALSERMKPTIIKLAMLSKVEEIKDDVENSFSFLSGADKFFLESPGGSDSKIEISRLQKDLEYEKGFLNAVMKKLNNENFVSKASPLIIEKERSKAADAQEKIRLIEERLHTIEQP